jgi:hypothetical protein
MTVSAMNAAAAISAMTMSDGGIDRSRIRIAWRSSRVA